MQIFPKKNKIYVLAAVWLVICASMFGYFFNILDRSNLAEVNAIKEKNKELSQLEYERDSFEKAKADLALLAKQDIQPKDFFSKDVTLVNEIETLEGIARDNSVDLILSGISGTVKTIPKAKTVSDIGTVPYNINLTGSLSNVVSFIETVEHLSFITNVTSLAVRGDTEDKVNVTMTASFYLSKQ